jgi:pimeloyl-ACP methyl ester carboxylesterase
MFRGIAYETYGHSGPVILFIHGFPFDRRMWSATSARLANDYRVLNIDLCGFGESPDRAMEGNDEYSMSRLADDCMAIVGYEFGEEKVVVCGLSMGGYVALEFWARHSKKPAGLIFCHTRATGDTDLARENRLKMADSVLSSGVLAVVEPMLDKLISETTKRLKPEVVRQVASWMESTRPEAIRLAQIAMSKRRDFSSMLSSIDVPCLFISGEDDQIVSVEEMAAMVQSVRESTHTIIKNAGHLSPIECPDQFHQALIGYLKKFHGIGIH